MDLSLVTPTTTIVKDHLPLKISLLHQSVKRFFFFFEEMKFNAQDFRFFVFVICTVSFWPRACFLDGKLWNFQVENGGEKPTQAVPENSKELCEPSTADPSENAPIVGEDAVSTQKDEVAPATAVDAPIADGEFFIYFFFFFVSLYHSLTVLKALSFLCLCVSIRSKLQDYRNSKLKVLFFFYFRRYAESDFDS